MENIGGYGHNKITTIIKIKKPVMKPNPFRAEGGSYVGSSLTVVLPFNPSSMGTRGIKEGKRKKEKREGK